MTINELFLNNTLYKLVNCVLYSFNNNNNNNNINTKQSAKYPLDDIFIHHAIFKKYSKIIGQMSSSNQKKTKMKNIL